MTTFLTTLKSLMVSYDVLFLRTSLFAPDDHSLNITVSGIRVTINQNFTINNPYIVLTA
jgi:hypothetical protein